MKELRNEVCIHLIKSCCGKPVVNKYKYLGSYFDPKLTMEDQRQSIKKKANFLLVKLYPYLSSATADGRRDMWKTMIFPLFNAMYVLVKFEKAKTEVEKMNTLLTQT